MAEVEKPLARDGGNLEQEMVYGNHESVEKWQKPVWQQVVDDVV